MVSESTISPVSPATTEGPETPKYSAFRENGEPSSSPAVNFAQGNGEEGSHPFAKSGNLLVVIPKDNGIDVEAEARFYDDLMIVSVILPFLY